MLSGMLIYAGIDEAGYGPMLGPLCIACTAFIAQSDDSGDSIDDNAPCDLWRRLKAAICRKRTDRRKRIAVDDSKKLKLPNDQQETPIRRKASAHPLKHLERGVLSFCMTSIDCPDCDGDLFARLSLCVSPASWYGSTTALPVAQTLDELRIAASRLRQSLDGASIDFAHIACEAIDAGQFNDQVARMGFKSTVNFCAVMRLIDAVWKRWPQDHPRIVVDRQGGRTHYLNDLLLAYPDAHIQILAEDDTLSRYRLDRNGSRLTVSFLVEAESTHLPVALASMTAKYVRELHMLRMNRFFQAMMPELKPTAGYFEDARRYIADIEPLMAQLGVDRRMLIRAV
jgi:ribonuclease HIII